MPTYEYRCPEGHQFDHFVQKMSEAQATMTCPVCGKVATRLVSGGAGLLFKGSGFYITDYGKSGSKKGSKETGDGASSGETTKSDKPATPTTPAAPSTTKSSGSKSSGNTGE